MQTVGSNHRIETSFVQASYSGNRTPSQGLFWAVDWYQLNNNPLLRHHKSVEMKNRYDALLEENYVEADYGHVMESIP